MLLVMETVLFSLAFVSFVLGMPIGILLMTLAYEQNTADQCAQCGYALKGLLTTRCPECGHDNPQQSEGPPRVRYRWLFALGLGVILLPMLGMACVLGMFVYYRIIWS